MDLKLGRAIEPWCENARCRGAEPVLFFPGGTMGMRVLRMGPGLRVGCRSDESWLAPEVWA